MYKAIAAFVVVSAVASFAPTALACIDDAPCPPRIPAYKQFIPRGVPDIPDIPKGVPKPAIPAIPKAAIPKAPPKADRAIERKAAADEAPRPADSDVKIVEKPASLRAPEPAPVCTRYLPSLGKAVEIPCE